MSTDTTIEPQPIATTVIDDFPVVSVETVVPAETIPRTGEETVVPVDLPGTGSNANLAGVAGVSLAIGVILVRFTRRPTRARH